MDDEATRTRADSASVFDRLDRWAARHCRKLRHKGRIRIESVLSPANPTAARMTLPSWFVNIYLDETPLEGRPFPESGDAWARPEWCHCWVSPCGTYQGTGSFGRLEAMLRAFLDWAESAGDGEGT